VIREHLPEVNRALHRPQFAKIPSIHPAALRSTVAVVVFAIAVSECLRTSEGPG
jgi:hypothetical protein